MTKRIDSADDWTSYHRGLDVTNPHQYWLELNNNSAKQFDSKGIWYQNPDSNNFYLSSYGNANANGANYVAYLFAHDPSTDGKIQCGSYAG